MDVVGLGHYSSSSVFSTWAGKNRITAWKLLPPPPWRRIAHAERIRLTPFGDFDPRSPMPIASLDDQLR
jgi:hypothetical protein